MRALTPEEQELLAARRSRFETLVDERMPVLKEFAEVLGLEEPAMIVADPEHYLPSVDVFMRDQTVGPDDDVWISTRLAYLIGDVLVQRLGGCWFLNDIPDSRYFARYVVGQFSGIHNPNGMVDPFEAAIAFASSPPGRNLLNLVAEIEDDLRAL